VCSTGRIEHDDTVMRRVPINRRILLGLAASGAVVGLSACIGGEDNDLPAATATPEPTATPDLTPTPTQEAIVDAVAGYSDPTKWQGRTLTIAGWGGDYQNAQEDAFFDPFAAATGVTIQIKRADLDGLRSQVDAENVTWDVMTVPMEDVLQLAHEQYLEPMNYQVIDRTALFADEIALQHGVGVAFYSTVIIYPAGSTNAPQDWADFWDLPPVGDDEPEPASLRSLRRGPVGTLEFALLADGVTTDALYPLDVERAFASLDRIREHIRIWWQEGKEPIQLVSSGEVGMASAWYTRLWQLEMLDTVRVQWFGGMLSADSWIVPRGAPSADIAMDFINYATRAVPSANFSRLVPFGPVNREALNLLRPDRAAVLPSSSANKAVQFVQNWNYWADNRDSLTQRFEDWFSAETTTGSPAPEGEA
jgi:putative spermidine/putrescine transport system substrate-binding protein